MRGIEPKTQDTIDLGIKRNLADYVKMDGYPEFTAVAAIATVLTIADRYGVKTSSSTSGYYVNSSTLKARRRFVAENYEERIRPLIRPVRRVTSTFRGVGTVAVAAAFEKMMVAAPEDFEHFISMLCGQVPPDGNVLLLRNRLEQNSVSKQRLRSEIIAALVIKTWNAYITGAQMQLLRFATGGANPEEFPAILDNEGKEIA